MDSLFDYLQTKTIISFVLVFLSIPVIIFQGILGLFALAGMAILGIGYFLYKNHKEIEHGEDMFEELGVDKKPNL